MTAKFKVTVFKVEKDLDLSAPSEEAYFKPCTAGNDESIGLIAANPMEDAMTWVHKDITYLQFQLQKRKVPDKWLRAEFARRTKDKTFNRDEASAIYEQTKAEMWESVLPSNDYGWVAYCPNRRAVFIGASPRVVEKVTQTLRLAFNSLPIESYLQPTAFCQMVRATLNVDREDEVPLELGDSLDLYGIFKATATFRKMDNLAGNDKVFATLKDFPNVQAANFTYAGDDGYFACTRYTDMVVPYDKDKELDDCGDILLQYDKASMYLDILTEVCEPYVTEKGEKL